MFTINSEPIKQIGYGAMVLEGIYGQSEENSAIATLTHVIDQNMMIDTADIYGAGHNEILVSKALKQSNKDAFVATKFGIVFEEDQTGTQLKTAGWAQPLTINGTRSYVKRAVDNSLERLGVEKIDLLYAHLLDPGTPLEETISAMAEAVKEGKVQAIGLSNVTAEEIIKANKMHPISAVECEYSLFQREAEKDIIPAVNRIGAVFVSYSPLAAGLLSGSVKELEGSDYRNNNPKFQGDNLTHNLQRFDQIKSIANDLSVTPAQLALAWLVAQGDNIIPIPGSRKKSRIDENLAALDIRLGNEVLDKFDSIAPIGINKEGTSS